MSLNFPSKIQELAIPAGPDQGQGQIAEKGQPALALASQVDQEGHDQKAQPQGEEVGKIRLHKNNLADFSGTDKPPKDHILGLRAKGGDGGLGRGFTSDGRTASVREKFPGRQVGSQHIGGIGPPGSGGEKGNPKGGEEGRGGHL